MKTTRKTMEMYIFQHRQPDRRTHPHPQTHRDWFCGMTDVEEQCGDGSVAGDVDHAEVVWEMALPGAHEEQPAGNTHTHTPVTPTSLHQVHTQGYRVLVK